jgi:hypothetical protein
MDSFFTSSTIAASATDSHPAIAAMLMYVSAFISGDFEPFWPHFILLSLSVAASFAVGAGIIFEAPRYSVSVHRVALWLVIMGVVVEAACTISLFVFDEGISGSQQSKIIALETRLASRALSDEQMADLVTHLTPFSGQHFDIVTYWNNPESLMIANRIYDALVNAGWLYDKPPNGEFVLGVETGVRVWFDKRADKRMREAASELVGSLLTNGIYAYIDPRAEQESPASEPIQTKLMVNVGIKP